jgi:hypothetical protein
MSRNLPDRPNLEYLKKEAKARLDQLQRSNPAAQLSDAQHTLAQEYGFASWPKLKAHVDAVSDFAEASADRAEHPLAGRWIANVALSKRHPSNQFQRAIITFAVRGNTVAVDDESIDEAGRLQRNRNVVVCDGTGHSLANGLILTATWRGRRVLHTVATRNGQVVGRGEYVVSRDGRRLTISANDGDQVIVLDREAVAPAVE